jgi:RimJ/RimL family protein N-acetyltransferase
MVLTTDRLLLRPWALSDAESLYAYAQDPDVGPIAGWPPHQSVEESRRIIETVFSVPECYAICEKENGVAIGAISLKMGDNTDMTDRADECELGYWLGKPFWGRGYMPEAAAAVLAHAFTDLEMRAVWCGYYEGNLKSKRVQEKLGFSYCYTSTDLEVPLLNEIRVGHTQKMTREDWQSRL